MSAGEFEISVYETNAGNFAGVKVQPETLEAIVDNTTNVAGAGPVNQEGRASVSGGKRSNGINCRTVTLEWTAAPPDGYSGDPVTIPALTPAFYAACNPNNASATGSYLGAAVRAYGRSPETVK